MGGNELLIRIEIHFVKSFPNSSVVKNPPAMQKTQVQSLGREDPLKKGMATHSSILARWC